MIIYACFDYDKKIEQGLLNKYNINFVKYRCDINTNDYCESIIEEYNGIYNMFPYSSNVVTGQIISDGVSEQVNYNILAKTLPFDKWWWNCAKLFIRIAVVANIAVILCMILFIMLQI